MSELKPCPFCHEDTDGCVCALDKNGHAFIRPYDVYPVIVMRFGKELIRREIKIKYCPICGRRLVK